MALRNFNAFSLGVPPIRSRWTTHLLLLTRHAVLSDGLARRWLVAGQLLYLLQG